MLLLIGSFLLLMVIGVGLLVYGRNDRTRRAPVATEAG